MSRPHSVGSAVEPARTGKALLAAGLVGYICVVESNVPALKTSLEPGDRLRRDLMNPLSRQILLPAGTVLTEVFIRKINSLGLDEQALRCVVRDFDAKRHAATELERGLPFEYSLYVEGKETVRVLLELAGRPSCQFAERDEAWERAGIYATHLLEKLESPELADFPDLRIYDHYMHSHPLNTATLAILIGKALGLERAHLRELALAALFADLGKARLPHAILYKPEKLTQSEMGWARTHAAMSAEFAEQFRWAQGIVRHVAGSHHERWDGSGYPKGVAGRTIPEEVSIVGLADAYDAMISDVPYRKRIEPAIAYRLASAGSPFDPIVLDGFKRSITPYPRGTSVRLSNGVEGKVTRVSIQNPYRPVVEIEGAEVDLEVDNQVRIVAHLIPRRFHRQVVTFDATVSNPAGQEIQGKAMDVSLGGVCIEAMSSPPQGEDLFVRLNVVGGQVTLVGHLLWARKSGGDKSVFALSAVPASDSDRERLMEVLLDVAGVTG